MDVALLLDRPLDARQEIDWNIVYCIITAHINDVREFPKQVLPADLG